ncbi:hypothetical protein M404DRAFT_1003635 [Pisolithus tinctorius Marx 270]|uniref:Uncharacterized protein n=1 Tax=Pisolithus tinctorius Marx 270 TaxID=870435 RepID=A0A0C3NI08_PISTI|nr:hypothetical protein M404DRAFT_1003635 [Pisolithus tinctorius Marx 270]
MVCCGYGVYIYSSTEHRQCNTSTSATSVCLLAYLAPSEVYQLRRRNAPAGRDVMQDDPNQIHPIPTSLPT